MIKTDYSHAAAQPTQPRSAAHSGRRSGLMRGGSVTLILKLQAVLVLGCLIFYGLKDWPYAAILFTDLIFCTYLITLFKSQYRYLFLLHPVILLIASQLYVTPFLDGGDGPAYAAVLAQYVDSSTMEVRLDGLLGSFDLIGLLKYTSFGIAPIYVVPEYFFASPADTVYYLWQGTFHVILSTVAITIARLWQVISDKYLFTMAFFVVMSPSFFDLGVAPTRHIVTFISVFFLFIAYAAIRLRLSATRAIGLIVAIALVMISKLVLLLPFFIFVFVDQIFLSGAVLNRRKFTLFTLVGIGMVFMASYFMDTLVAYQETAITGAATFSAYAQLPLVGWVVKYVYALLSPFPWSDASLFVSDTYGGNWFLFAMHVLSSLMGLYLFLIMLVHVRRIFNHDPELTRLLVYGLIMSLSILRGSTGFHVYLLIYFPFFAPLLTIKKYRVHPMVPLGFVILLEAFILSLK